jgi:hypothetical protein
MTGSITSMDRARTWCGNIPGRFSHIGLTVSRPLNGLEQLDSIRAGAPNVYYKLDLLGGGKERLVYDDNECIGRCDEYSTVFWIFKPGTTVKLHNTKCRRLGSKRIT